MGISMTNRWDSSARPLFVKTIYVNGSRHAILSEEDPVLQSRNLFLRKQIRSDSSMSYSSTHSAVTQESQRTSSEVSFKACKTDGLSSKDLSTELQRCLVKLQFPVSIQEPGGTRKSIGDWCKETEIFGKEIARKCSQCKFNKKVDRDHEYFKEPFTEEYAARKEEENECACDVASGNVKEIFGSDSKSMKFLMNCKCTKISGDSENQLPSERNQVDLDKNESILGETFRNLIMGNKPGDRAHVKNQRDYFYNVSSSNNVELYWNNYLAKTFNTSLTDRVVQWMDLAKKQKKNEDKEKILRKQLSVNTVEGIVTKKAEKQGVQKSVSATKFSNGRNTIKGEVETSIKKERAFDSRDSGSSDVESETKLNYDREVISFVEKTQMGKLDGKKVISSINDEALMPEAKLQRKSEVGMNESAVNNHSEADSLINEHQIASSNKSKSEAKHAVKRDEKETSSSMLFIKKGVPKLYNNYFLHPLDGVRADPKKVKGIKMGPMSFQEKRAASANETRRDSSLKVSIGHDKIRSQTQKSANDFTRFTNTKTWMNQVVSEDNYMSISRANILNQHFMMQQNHRPNDMLRVRDGRTIWETGKSTEKPQLHIFIPSVSRKEVSEETISECESFLN